MTTSNADLKKSHKYYKKKVNDIEEERSIDRSSEMWRISRDHENKLKYKTELLHAKNYQDSLEMILR